MNRPSNTLPLYSKHRIEALTDGVFAVAMTLLVLELKVPEFEHRSSNAELVNALVLAIPKLGSWVVSFAFLIAFWAMHHRIFHRLAQVDGTMILSTLLYLLFVSLVPFGAALLGSFGYLTVGAALYCFIFLALALLAGWQVEHLVRTPLLLAHALGTDQIRWMRIRNRSLILCSACAAGLAFVSPPFAGLAFLPMLIVGPIARRAERKAVPAV